MVRAGLYKGAGNRGLTFRGYPKSVVSILGASYTVVDAELQERSVYIDSGESYYTYLSGIQHPQLQWSCQLNALDTDEDQLKPGGFKRDLSAGLTLHRGYGADNGGCIYMLNSNATLSDLVLNECQVCNPLLSSSRLCQCSCQQQPCELMSCLISCSRSGRH